MSVSTILTTKLCECGCGNPTTIFRGVPRNFINGHQNKGKNHPKWRGGRYQDKLGYILIWKPDHPRCDENGYVFEHRLIMEEFLGRYLTEEEVVHHINCIKHDNRITNLQLFENHSKHVTHERTKDYSHRFCVLCGGNHTYHNSRGSPTWLKYNGGYICGKCNVKLNYHKKRDNPTTI